MFVKYADLVQELELCRIRYVIIFSLKLLIKCIIKELVLLLNTSKKEIKFNKSLQLFNYGLNLLLIFLINLIKTHQQQQVSGRYLLVFFYYLTFNFQLQFYNTLIFLLVWSRLRFYSIGRYNLKPKMKLNVFTRKIIIKINILQNNF
ncbi:hypothetical protein pb186bvf_002131 [Paramecium bursaria]